MKADTTEAMAELPGCGILFVATLVASAVVALGLTASMPTFALYPFVLFVTFGVATFIGLPVCCVAVERGWTHWWCAVLGGIATGTVVPCLLTLPVLISENALAGAIALGGLGACGAMGGIAFWLVTKLFAVMADWWPWHRSPDR